MGNKPQTDEKSSLITGLGHINIVVDDLEYATKLYGQLLGATVVRTAPHFKNSGFAKSAGFLQHPEQVDVSIRFLELKLAKVYLELMHYHAPIGKQSLNPQAINDLGGPRHICLNVNDIDAMFERVQALEDVRLISDDPNYYPCAISPVSEGDYDFTDDDSMELRQKICEIVPKIRFFYCVDPYGVTWEFEQR